MTRSLIFSMIEIRPDIGFSIMVSACFVKNFSHAYIKTAKTIFYYLKISIVCGIIYSSNRKNNSIKGYLDFDLTRDKES